VGGGLGLGDGDVSGEVTLSALPMADWIVGTGSLTAALGQPVLLEAGAWLAGPPSSMAASLHATATAFPEDRLRPAARLEWAPGLGGADWSVDGGIAWLPQRFIQFAVTGRVEGDALWIFGGLSLFEDPEGS
jgi:hypothetical protein